MEARPPESGQRAAAAAARTCSSSAGQQQLSGRREWVMSMADFPGTLTGKRHLWFTFVCTASSLSPLSPVCRCWSGMSTSPCPSRPWNRLPLFTCPAPPPLFKGDQGPSNTVSFLMAPLASAFLSWTLFFFGIPITPLLVFSIPPVTASPCPLHSACGPILLLKQGSHFVSAP